MNFRDVMTSTGRISVETVARGRLNQECVQGLEFAGKTSRFDFQLNFTQFVILWNYNTIEI